MKIKKRILALITAVVAVFTFVVTGCSLSKPKDNTGSITAETPEQNVAQTNNQMMVTLNAPFPATSEDGTVSKIITATIMPVDAPNKAVDWTVYWIENPFGDTENVSDYITVEPESDGALAAQVTAHKGFEGAKIGVKASTRVGGFTAVCVVDYDGAPETFNVRCNDAVYNSTDYISLVAGSSYNMNLELHNTLNAIGSKYGTYELVSVTGYGQFVADKTIYQRGAATQYTTENIQVSDNIEYFLSATLNGSVLTVQAKHSVSSFFKSQYGSNGGIEWKYKSAYYDPRGNGQPTDCYVGIYLKETVSGKTCMINVRVTATVESITLSNSTLTF